MSKFEYTDDMVARMNDVAASGVTEEVIEQLVDEFEYPRRSVTAKLRKLGYDVPRKPGAAPVFSAEETEALAKILEDNSGNQTADEIAAGFSEGKFTARQINGKALSLEMTQHIKPAEKKVTPKTYTEEEEASIQEMVEGNSYLEEIADSLGKSVNSVRGKLLSMGLKATQRDRKASKSDPYEGIDDMLGQSVEELADHFDKTVRGVKTVLTRRGLACSDYTPKSAED
jgi:DNA-directed RNA polymerase specialized sigma24 family protein